MHPSRLERSQLTQHSVAVAAHSQQASYLSGDASDEHFWHLDLGRLSGLRSHHHSHCSRCLAKVAGSTGWLYGSTGRRRPSYEKCAAEVDAATARAMTAITVSGLHPEHRAEHVELS